MQADRDTFGPRLRLERERRGITLKHIAESTKIKESLFAELERGDVSKWPQGIFRRAHLCAYVSAIGLPSQPILSEFLQLFPDEHLVDQADPLRTPGASTSTDTQTEAGQATPLVQRDPSLADRTWVVFFNLAAICLIASIVAAASGFNLYLAVALVGLAYFAVGSACYAGSVGGEIQNRIRRFVRSRNRPQAAETPIGIIIAARDIRDMNQEPEIHRQRASA